MVGIMSQRICDYILVSISHGLSCNPFPSQLCIPFLQYTMHAFNWVTVICCACVHMNVHTKRKCEYKCFGMIIDSIFSKGGHCECSNHAWLYISFMCINPIRYSEPCILAKWFQEAERDYVKYIYTSTLHNFLHHLQFLHTYIHFIATYYTYVFWNDCDNYVSVKVQGKANIAISGYSVRKVV